VVAAQGGAGGAFIHRVAVDATGTLALVADHIYPGDVARIDIGAKYPDRARRGGYLPIKDIVLT